MLPAATLHRAHRRHHHHHASVSHHAAVVHHTPWLVTAIHMAGLVIEWTFLALVAALALRLIIGVIRFAAAPVPVKLNYPSAIWHSLRWRWLSRNLGFAYVDPHRQKVKFRAAMGPAIGKDVRIQKDKRTKVRYPRARFRPDAFGLVVKVKTIPKVGRAEVEKNADHLGNAWRCVRVQVSQPKPGRLIVRGLRRDPLAVRFGMEEAPAGTYSDPRPDLAVSTPYVSRVRRTRRQAPCTQIAPRLYLGRDEWADHRHVSLSGLTGITIAGLPGFGKTSEVLSWILQLAPLDCVQFVTIDGKGGGDYDPLRPRCWIAVGDELPGAAGVLEDVHALMRYRLANVVELTGGPNAWHMGPTPEFPLIVTIVDECHTFFDLDAVKGSSKEAKEAEQQVRTCRALSGQLVRKGRSVLFLTIFITQKQTSDAIPTAIRDNCGLGMSFAVKTKDAAVAALGDDIRKYDSYCPTGLQERPDYIGVCTTTLRTGKDPFTRVRVPEVSPAAAAARFADLAHLRRDPSVAQVPDAVHAGV